VHGALIKVRWVLLVRWVHRVRRVLLVRWALFSPLGALGGFGEDGRQGLVDVREAE
jgi:hypothetical protein